MQKDDIDAEILENSEKPSPEIASVSADNNVEAEVQSTPSPDVPPPDPGNGPEKYPESSPENDIEQLKDKLQRTLAELENTRRRFEREKQEMAKYAIASFATDILSLADNLERGLKAVSAESKTENDALNNFFQGVELSARELGSIFERNNITKISPEKGDAFSYNHHQAVSEMITQDYPAGSVVELLQHGYILHDRLIRPAMVIVSKSH